MTLEQFTASREAVDNVRLALIPHGYDYGDEWAVPGYIYAEDCAILGPDADGLFTTWWVSEEYVGSLEAAERYLFAALEGEGLL